MDKQKAMATSGV